MLELKVAPVIVLGVQTHVRVLVMNLGSVESPEVPAQTSLGEISTRNEVEVSDAERARYHLYRVFAYGREPRLFTLHGSLRRTCLREPIQYRAEVA